MLMASASGNAGVTLVSNENHSLFCLDKRPLNPVILPEKNTLFCTIKQ